MVPRFLPTYEDKLESRFDAYACVDGKVPASYDLSIFNSDFLNNYESEIENKSIHIPPSLDMQHTFVLFGGFIMSNSAIFKYMVKVLIDIPRLQRTPQWKDHGNYFYRVLGGLMPSFFFNNIFVVLHHQDSALTREGSFSYFSNS